MQFYGTTTAGPIYGKAWDPRSGWSTIVKYSGREAELLVLLNTYKASNNRVVYEPDEQAGYGTLTVTLGTDDSQDINTALSDTWTLAGNDLEKSVWEHPKVLAWFLDSATAQQKATFRADVDAVIRGEKEIADLDLASPFLSSTSAEIETLIGEMALGLEAYSLSQYVLRHVVVVVAGSNIRPAYVGINEIWTTTQLNSYEAIPSTIQFVLPEGWWLKRTPTVEQTASDKFTLTQEWYHDSSEPSSLYTRYSG